MLRLGFDALGLHRIVARCDGRNVASTRVMEKLGMRREAHFRANETVKGEWTHEVVSAMMSTERRRGGEASEVKMDKAMERSSSGTPATDKRNNKEDKSRP